MLHDIITDTIAPQPDIDIVGKGMTEMDLLDAAEQTNADIVITVRNAATEGKDYDDLLYRHGRIKVLEISAEGGYGSLCEMRPRRVALGEMSPLRLLEAIRGSAGMAAGANR
jgi:chemotaxis response regulator CheB